jgi:hypothetical protein
MTAALIAAVPLAVIAFHWRAARPGWAFAGRDVLDFFLAMRDAVNTSLRAGKLPLWQRGIFLGYPLVADPQAALFDFSTWLTIPWDAARGLTLGTLLHLVVMGWGMAFWMRARGLGRVEALLAAVLFPLGTKQTVHLQHWNFAATTAWWPWMLGALDAFAVARRARHLVMLAVSVAACWCGGSPQMAYFGMVLVGLWTLRTSVEAWRDDRRAAVLPWLAIGAGLLLAMPAVLPTLELARFGPRAAGVDYAFTTVVGWRTGWDAALLLLPHAFGHSLFWEGTNPWEAAGYLGILPLALAVAAPWHRRGVVMLAALAIGGFWLSYGDGAWLGVHHLAFRFVPGFSVFRVPTRTLMVTSFCLAALAAEGLGAVRESEKRRRPIIAAILGVVSVAVLLAWWPGFPLDRVAARRDALVAVMVGAVALGWGVFRPLVGRRATWAVVAIAVTGADLYVAAGSANAVAPVEALGPEFATCAGLIPGSPAPRRVTATGDALINETRRVGWEGTLGYGPMLIERVRMLIEATRLSGSGDEPQVDLLRPRGDPTSPLWPLLSSPWLVSEEPWRLPVIARTRVATGAELFVQRAAALPRVFWTGAFEQASDEDVGPRLAAAARGDRAIVADVPPFASGPPAGPLPAEDVAVYEDALEARVISPRAGLAVVLDPWFPGWEATVDGVATPVLRANYAFQAVPVPAGVHHLALIYRSRPLILGAALAAAGLALLAGIAALAARSGRT